MSETRDLLIEIGTEELPPKALRSLKDAFAKNLARGLIRNRNLKRLQPSAVCAPKPHGRPSSNAICE